MIDNQHSDFLASCVEIRSQVWPIIEHYLTTLDANLKASASNQFEAITETYKAALTAYPKRQGKYVRPTLLILTAEAMGAPIANCLLMAAAWQLSEEWILIHDDWEDKSLERRGGPTLHHMFNAETAVNAGDGLHILMWKMIADTHHVLDASTTFKLIDETERVLSRTALGQSAEINFSADTWENLTDDQFYFVADGKTSNYTIAGPMRLGAIIAGATEIQLADLLTFGQVLGKAFQIRDDYLDLVSDFTGLKKQQGNDVYESKKTLILSHLLRTIPPADKPTLLAILRKTRDEKTAEDVAWVIEKMRSNGSLDFALKTANDLANQALEIFNTKLSFLDHEPARAKLQAGIKFMVERDH